MKKRRYLLMLPMVIGSLWIMIAMANPVPYEIWTETLTWRIQDDMLPIFAVLTKEKEHVRNGEMQSIWLKEFPLMVQAVAEKEVSGEGDTKPENLPDNTFVWEGTKRADTEPETDAIAEAGIEEDVLAAMRAENGILEDADEEITAPKDFREQEIPSIQITSDFQKNVKTNSYDLEALADYQTFVSTFYTIDAGTTAGSNELNLEKLLSKDVTIKKEGEGPQILIYHTHSLEGFADSVPGERSQTIVGVGDRLTEILTEEYGYRVLHHTAEYDTKRDDAYANSLPDITKVLEENPDIQVVIDLHRDAGLKGVRRAIELNGKPTATFMLFNGLSRTRKTGAIDYLYNPYLADNLSFSFQMQMKAGEYYPGLTRKIYLKAYRYNMHLKPLTLLIELGDSNNTVEEAMNTCDPLAHILDMVLSGEG